MRYDKGNKSLDGLMATPITIELPEETHHTLEKLAQQQGVTIQEVIANRFLAEENTLPPDLLVELEALNHLSDDALWTIARERLSEQVERRLQELTATKQPSDEMEALLERADRVMLRKAEASAILTRRGYKVELRDLK
jgi:predicted transcriptional regulator